MIDVMWELSEAVPVNVKDFWTQRVVALYEDGHNAAAFEEAFRVIEPAVVARSRELNGPERFSVAVVGSSSDPLSSRAPIPHCRGISGQPEPGRQTGKADVWVDAPA
jgi:hypothetical protein